MVSGFDTPRPLEEGKWKTIPEPPTHQSNQDGGFPVILACSTPTGYPWAVFTLGFGTSKMSDGEIIYQTPAVSKKQGMPLRGLLPVGLSFKSGLLRKGVEYHVACRFKGTRTRLEPRYLPHDAN